MNDCPPQRCRESFDEVADLYARARPGYPAELIGDLVDMAGLGAGSRVLEIGCGTGQLTVPLAERGAQVVAVELGPRLAAVARRRTARFDRVEVVEADFERWPLPAEPFDLVVAATSFHWLDPRTRVAKCGAACAGDGALAIIETHWGWGAQDRFAEESQSCYARWDPHHRPGGVRRILKNLEDQHPDLQGSHFETAIGRRYIVSREYGASRYCDLLRTFSDVRALDERQREGLLGCLADLIRTRFAGRIFRQDVYELWVAR